MQAAARQCTKVRRCARVPAVLRDPVCLRFGWSACPATGFHRWGRAGRAVKVFTAESKTPETLRPLALSGCPDSSSVQASSLQPRDAGCWVAPVPASSGSTCNASPGFPVLCIHWLHRRSPFRVTPKRDPWAVTGDGFSRRLESRILRHRWCVKFQVAPVPRAIRGACDAGLGFPRVPHLPAFTGDQPSRRPED